MAAIGTVVFCTDCGNLLDSSEGNQQNTLFCDICGASNKDTSSKTLVTSSKPSAFPSSLRQRLTSKTQTLSDAEREEQSTDAIASEKCELCGGSEVRYYTQQLRSADEGSTVFYYCTCGHKWLQNN